MLCTFFFSRPLNAPTFHHTTVKSWGFFAFFTVEYFPANDKFSSHFCLPHGRKIARARSATEKSNWLLASFKSHWACTDHNGDLVRDFLYEREFSLQRAEKFSWDFPLFRGSAVSVGAIYGRVKFDPLRARATLVYGWRYRWRKYVSNFSGTERKTRKLSSTLWALQAISTKKS